MIGTLSLLFISEKLKLVGCLSLCVLKRLPSHVTSSEGYTRGVFTSGMWAHEMVCAIVVPLTV